MIKNVYEMYNFTNAINPTNNKELVIVHFWAPWSKPCQEMEPILESISRRFTSVLDIVKVNIDDAEEIAKAHNIRSIPTTLFYRNIKVIKSDVGFRDENYLNGVIAEILKNIA